MDAIEAKAHILSSKYPGLKTESMSIEMVEGLLMAAAFIKEAIAPVVVTATVVVPTVVVESADEPEVTSRYRDYNKIKK